MHTHTEITTSNILGLACIILKPLEHTYAHIILEYMYAFISPLQYSSEVPRVCLLYVPILPAGGLRFSSQDLWPSMNTATGTHSDLAIEQSIVAT